MSKKTIVGGKKVLIIINNLGIGGAERVVVDDINELLRRNIEVKLITLKPEYKKSFMSQLNLPKSKTECIPFKGFLDVTSWRTLIRSLKDCNPDLLITHLWYANTIGRVGAIFAGVGNVISFEQVVGDTLKSWKAHLADWLLQFSTTRVVAVSEAVKTSLIKHHIREKRIAVIHNSVDMSIYADTYDNSTIRKEYGISDDTFLYVFIGRLAYQKAVDVLIHAFKKVHGDTRLLIVGKGKDRSMLEQLVKEKELKDRILFTGVRSDVPRLLSASDCFVLPSRFEGLPLVLTEALAAGAVIVTTDFEGAREIIVHERNGLMVKKEDPSSLAEALNRVRDDASLRKRLSGGARDSAEQFSIPRHVDAIMQYTDV